MTSPAPRSTSWWPVVVVALLVLVLGGVVLAVTGVLGPSGTSAPGAAPTDAGAPVPEPSTPAPTPTPTPTPTPPPDAVFTVVAAGDVLPHSPVISSARTDSGYDFAPLLAPIEPWVAGADLALCHLEVPVAPAGTAPSGYPVFGAPPEIAASLAANGWDGCSTASNHSLDRGLAGAVATLDTMDAAGLGHVGTARSATEATSPQVYELPFEGQTVRVAHIAATYGTNGIPVPADAPWSVTLIDTAGLIAQATQARTDGADVVIASVHCCTEYVSQATQEQQRIATELAASGVVDLLIGHHAHVPQPIERLEGGPRGEGMWVAHGLGNLISNQDANCCTARTDSGLLLTATFRKPVDEPATVTSVEWTAVTVDRFGGHLVHPLPGPATAGSAGTLGPEALAARYGRVAEVAVGAAPERLEPPTPTGVDPVVVPRPR